MNSCPPPAQQIQEYNRMKMSMLICAKMMKKRSYTLPPARRHGTSDQTLDPLEKCLNCTADCKFDFHEFKVKAPTLLLLFHPLSSSILISGLREGPDEPLV